MFGNLLNSKFYAICNAAWRIMMLTFLFIIFSLPLFTVGTALTALIGTLRLADYTTFATFWKLFKENLVRGSVVLLFTGFTLLFIMQMWTFMNTIPAGNIIFMFIAIFLVVYNINAYMLVSILKKCNLTFFRQVFFFTIGTFYKTFFIPILTIAALFLAPIIGGDILLFMSIPFVLGIYMKMIKHDLETINEFL